MKPLDEATSDLKKGKRVQLRLAGNSMTPKVMNKELVTVYPIQNHEKFKKGQVVLCKVRKKTYLHLVLATMKGQVLIGNNHGHVNGWISTKNVYGIMNKKPRGNRPMQVGTVVRLKTPCLGNEVGTQGVCYDIYRIGALPPGAAVIFENGNYDGFSLEEQGQFLEIMEDTPLDYTFTNVMQLDIDFRKGIFGNIKSQ